MCPGSIARSVGATCPLGEAGPVLTIGQPSGDQASPAPASLGLALHERVHLLLGHSRAGGGEGLPEDGLGRRNRGPDAGHLGRGLAPAQLPDDGLRRDQPPGVRTAVQVAQEQLVHPVGQPVGIDIRGRGVDGDAGGVQPPEGFEERRPDALIVGDDRGIRAGQAGGFLVKAADDGNPLAAGGQEQGALPGEGRVPIDHRQDGVGLGRGLAHEGQPGVHALFPQDANGLIDFFLNEGGHTLSFTAPGRRSGSSRSGWTGRGRCT